jgi:hypothetical protein
MRSVRLPIYADGKQTGDVLEIDVRFFLGSAGSETAHRFIRVDKAPTPEEEVEMLDRILHGFPPQPKQLFENQIAHDDKPGQSDDPRGWRTIKGFSGYIINSRGMIIDKQTQKTVATEVKFDRRRAMLCDDNNSMKWMNVEWLMFKMFPELTN